MGEAVGAGFVSRTFSPTAKARVLAIVRNLQRVLKADLDTLRWMSPATRREAIAKLDRLTVMVGYPDRWRDYSALRIAPGPFITNLLAADRFEYDRQIGKIGRPIDRGEWDMTPSTVNAYQQKNLNEIVIPAGILQPPFFDPAADDATNYGTAGTFIGHEMTHAFDDIGRQFDAAGNLRDWWTAEDAAHYAARADRIVEQFNGYVGIDSLHVNGALTKGENIADLGGIKVAYLALERSLAGRTRRAIDGFTPEQRFFLAYARSWAENVRPAYARKMIGFDRHAPGRWRVDGPLSNLPEFAAAFHCQAGQAMVRPARQRVSIW